MIIVGLDLSLTSAGIAVLVDGRPKVITHVGHTGKSAASWQQRSRRVRGQVQAVMRVVVEQPIFRMRKLDLAVIEGPSYASAHGDVYDRAALWHGVYGALDAKHIPVAVLAPNTLKLWWTGNGAASKADMTNAAMVRFVEPVSCSDEADALSLAVAGAFKLGDPIPFEPSQRQIDALEKVAWPEGIEKLCSSA